MVPGDAAAAPPPGHADPRAALPPADGLPAGRARHHRLLGSPLAAAATANAVGRRVSARRQRLWWNRKPPAILHHSAAPANAPPCSLTMESSAAAGTARQRVWEKTEGPQRSVYSTARTSWSFITCARCSTGRYVKHNINKFI